MGGSVIVLGGVTIWAPLTAATNLLLAVQCTWCCTRLGGRGEPARRSWRLFFAWMAVAAAAGAVKHALRPDLGPAALAAVHWASTLSSGLGVCWAEGAVGRVEGGWWGAWSRHTRTGQLLGYLGLNVLLGPRVALMIANTALGLLPVIFAEVARARRGGAGAAWVAAGLAWSILPGLVYALKIRPTAWISHVDIAHALMAVSYGLVLRGASASQHKWRPCYASS